LICSGFGNEHKQYDCVKIFHTRENITPDFNIYDYGIGFDEILFADRYIRVPLCGGALPMLTGTCDTILTKTKFCNFIYSNSMAADPVREHFYWLLSKYKHVDSGGALLNNIGERVKNKVAWQRDYKFTIAFENSSKPGYTTEKIVDALRAHTIPIYWGNPEVAKDFNVKRFINCHDYSSFEEVVEHIIKIDSDDVEYGSIISQPWFPAEKPPLPPEKDPVVISFLKNIVEQGPEKARRVVKFGNTMFYLRHKFGGD
jgi:hypothetical protein